MTEYSTNDNEGTYVPPSYETDERRLLSQARAALRTGEASRNGNCRDGAPPTILLAGARRAGKTSIQRVVFHKMSPHETLFLDPTGSASNTVMSLGQGMTPNSLVGSARAGSMPLEGALGAVGSQRPEITLIANNALVQFEVWDFPGDFDFSVGALLDNNSFVPEKEIFERAGVLIYVMDAQDQGSEGFDRLRDLAARTAIHNPSLPLEVFIHKMDGDYLQSHQQKSECQSQVQTEIRNQLREAGITGTTITYYQTSIYDHSVFDAFSRSVQRLVPQHQLLGNLLDGFTNATHATKAFLYDVVSKLFLANDSAPPGDHTELCADMLDVVVDVSCIYGYGVQSRGRATTRARSRGSTIGAGQTKLLPQASPPNELEDAVNTELEIEGYAFDDESEACIRLGDGMALYLREVAPYVALVALIKDEVLSNGLLSSDGPNGQSFWGSDAPGETTLASITAHTAQPPALEMGLHEKGLIEYNVGVIKKALDELFQPITPAAQERLGMQTSTKNAESASVPIAQEHSVTGKQSVQDKQASKKSTHEELRRPLLADDY